MAAFEWTEDMPAVCTHPEIEPHQRLALSMAAAAFESIMEQDRERPVFNGGVFASAANDTAHELVAAIEEALGLASDQTGLTPEGAHRQHMVTVAARGADQLWRESQDVGVTMERYWPRFLLRFGIHDGRRPKHNEPFPVDEVVTLEGEPGDPIPVITGGATPPRPFVAVDVDAPAEIEPR